MKYAVWRFRRIRSERSANFIAKIPPCVVYDSDAVLWKAIEGPLIYRAFIKPWQICRSYCTGRIYARLLLTYRAAEPILLGSNYEKGIK